MDIEIRNDEVVLTGYVNAVERFSKTLQEHGKHFTEKIQAGAFKRALENKENVQMLFNHNPNYILAEQKKGNLELKEDNIGLKVRARIKDGSIIELAKNKSLTGWSFGFRCLEDVWEEEKRTVKELDLLEVSLLTVEPAYLGTSVELEQRETKNSKIELRNVEVGSIVLEKEEEKVKEEKTEENSNKIDVDEANRQKQLLNLK